MLSRRIVFLSCCLLAFGGPVLFSDSASAASGPGSVSADSTDRHTHARQLFVRGMTKAFLDDHDAAIEHFERALDLVPGEPAVLAALADAHAARNRFASALYYARQAHVRSPKPHYALQLADLQRRDGRLEAAVTTYRNVVDQSPDLMRARRALAETYTERGDLEAAADTYEHLLDRSQDAHPKIRLELLRLYRSLDNPDGVERTLRSLIRLHPTDRSYQNRLGEFYIRQGRTDEAIAVYEALAEAMPADANLMVQLATLYRERGDDANAKALLDRFMGRTGKVSENVLIHAYDLLDTAAPPTSTSDSSALRTAHRLVEQALARSSANRSKKLALLGRLEMYLGHPAAAATRLHESLDANPRVIARWPLAVRAYVEAGQIQQGVALAEEALVLFPEQPSLIRAKADALFRGYRTAEALAHYREALRILSSTQTTARATLLTAIGRALDRLSRHQEAAEAYQQALTLSPGSPTVAAHYALHLAEQDVDLSEAARHARKAVAASDSSALSLHALGWITVRRGDALRGRTLLKQAIAKGRETSRIYQHLGEAHHILGDEHAARRAWKNAKQKRALNTQKNSIDSP